MFSNPQVLPNEDVDYIDDILLINGILQVVSAATLAELNQIHLVIWGNKRGVYCFPTIELIEWLKEKIAGRKAIEICSGTGAIGRALGIVSTDSYIQTTPEMIAYYRLAGQIPIFPPIDVKKFEANEAVDYYKPQVVLGSYITQKFLPGDEQTKTGSSVYGVDELAMLPKIETYIAVGNSSTHGDKRLLKLPHERFCFPWIYTRSLKPELNEIVVWNSNATQ